uniref:Reverse transcriptase zinc-binding domain-containing protein n=1 Tax=Quercus lobata TaxID=97700 RepID=A0A7N2M7C9_QUELO
MIYIERERYQSSAIRVSANLRRSRKLLYMFCNFTAANLIDRHFYPPDAKLIKSLPLCSIPQSDVLIWPKEKTGTYSVKSGYKLLCEWQNEELNQPRISDIDRNFWSSIWKINVPGKIKHFIWKACSNSLPTKENLLKRKIVQDAVCQRCSNDSVDVVHSLWSCDGLRETRPHSVALFAAIAWSVWYHRNKLRLGEASIPLGQIRRFARDYIRDFKTLTSKPSAPVRTAPRGWRPPANDVWKINFDGANFGESDEAGIGVIIRDCRGKVKAALSEKIKKASYRGYSGTDGCKESDDFFP